MRMMGRARPIPFCGPKCCDDMHDKRNNRRQRAREKRQWKREAYA